MIKKRISEYILIENWKESCSRHLGEECKHWGGAKIVVVKSWGQEQIPEHTMHKCHHIVRSVWDSAQSNCIMDIAEPMHMNYEYRCFSTRSLVLT